MLNALIFACGKLVAVHASKCAPLGMLSKKVGNDIHIATYDWKSKINVLLLLIKIQSNALQK